MHQPRHHGDDEDQHRDVDEEPLLPECRVGFRHLQGEIGHDHDCRYDQGRRFREYSQDEKDAAGQIMQVMAGAGFDERPEAQEREYAEQGLLAGVDPGYALHMHGVNSIDDRRRA